MAIVFVSLKLNGNVTQEGPLIEEEQVLVDVEKF
jgi:hypothetical protein